VQSGKVTVVDFITLHGVFQKTELSEAEIYLTTSSLDSQYKIYLKSAESSGDETCGMGDEDMTFPIYIYFINFIKQCIQIK
jgi:hypothetical protein